MEPILLKNGLTVTEALYLERDLIHMNIDRKFKLIQNDLNENLVIFSQRYRCNVRERFEHKARLTRYFSYSHDNIVYLLKCICGVISVQHLDGDLARNIILIYPRNYNNHLLAAELIRDIETFLKNFIPYSVQFSLRATNDPARNNVIVVVLSHEGINS